MSVVALAPNWLGDAVMALPALDDIRRHTPGERLLVAARPSVAALFALVPGVDGVVTLSPGTPLSRVRAAVEADARALAAEQADTVILFPNSIHSAVIAARAGARHRWGYHHHLRGVFLTRAVRPLRRPHQVDAYRHLVAALGMTNGPREPVLALPPACLDEARAWLRQAGWDGQRPLVGVAPGAAGGRAKRWPPDRVAQVVAGLVASRGATCVLVGTASDAVVTSAVSADAARIAGPGLGGRVIDAAGRTNLAQLAGILGVCAVFVSNDSGAMHLAAAVGTPLVAVFGPTDERATSPVGRPGSPATVLSGSAWCRPCGLRECPLDHRCMRSITVDRVLHAAGERL